MKKTILEDVLQIGDQKISVISFHANLAKIQRAVTELLTENPPMKFPSKQLLLGYHETSNRNKTQDWLSR